MITVIPVALVVPALLVFIPPAMVFAPALLPSFVQFAPFMVGFATVPAMPLNRFMQLVFGMLNTALASLVDLLTRLSERTRRCR